MLKTYINLLPITGTGYKRGMIKIQIDVVMEEIKRRNKITKMFLDYDGTLVPLVSSPEMARPDSDLLETLRCLRKKYKLFIVTGRDLNDIHGFIGDGFNIIAMHGAEAMDEYGKVSRIKDFEWYSLKTAQLARKYAHFQEQFPGLRIIDKHGGLQFHYFNMKGSHVKEFERAIAGISEDGFELYSGKYVFELRIKGINKGISIQTLMNEGEYVLFAGDDMTDEEAFEILKDQLTIKIGEGETKARFRLESFIEFRELLKMLCTNIEGDQDAVQ